MTVENEHVDTVDQGPCHDCGRVNSSDARFCAGCGYPLTAHREEGRPAGMADPLIGRIIAGRYKIENLIGRGGMGVVYRVEHVHIGKLMAMKLLHGELARDRHTIKRFEREAQAARLLTHPNTVQVFDFGREGGLTYLVMEYVEGRDLGTIIKQEGPVDFTRAARIGEQVCASLGEAHHAGVIHRDLKPENVMVSEHGPRRDRVKVLDFGLAKLREQEGMAGASITRAGSVLGTPYYMAPEQIRGEDVDHRADVYAVGALLYKAITGAPPFSASTPMGVLTKHLTETVDPPSTRIEQLPPTADVILLRALEKDRNRRYQQIEEMRHDLVDYLASVGEAVASSSSQRLSGTVPAVRGLQRTVVATRSEVEHYERSLRRRGYLVWLAFLILAGAVIATGMYVWQKSGIEPEPETVEREPNNDPAKAQRLAEGATFRAYLGKRISIELSDADVYRIVRPAERQALRVEVSSIPNMDIVLEVVRSGYSTPVLTADSGGIGQAERIPNFPISAADYYLRVREQWVSGQRPTENVSDEYTIRYELSSPGPEEELEINDSIEQANAIGLGEVHRGYIGWDGDVDIYCMGEDAEDVVASLDGVLNLDLVLRVIDRDSSDSVRVDERPVGEGEQSQPIEMARADRLCLQIAAEPAPEVGAARANADAAYVLRVAPAAPAAPGAPGAPP